MTFEYERVVTPRSGLRLHLNENTAGCSPSVLAAVQALTRQQAAFYPDYEETTAACARYLGIQPDQLLLTNGLDEGILAASIAALRKSGSGPAPEALILVPAFDMYAACSDAAGGRVVEVPLATDFAFPYEEVLSAIGTATRLVFLTTPNNPTGQTIPRRHILDIAGAAPDALVFVDEAYADFSGETVIGAPELERLPNVVIGRTFAKAYGLAALRAGAVIGAPATLAPLRRVVPPYSLNVCATVALGAALADTAYYQWYVDQVAASKALLYEALGRLGIRYWPSAANFVLADFGARAQRVVEGLASREIYVRDRSRDHACPGCVRITAGVVEHTQACVRALENVLCGAA
jgi:histidinol-phosphate aminotransferase